MKIGNHRASVFLWVVLIAGLIGCASTRTQESTGQYIDDSVITTKVKAKIAEDEALKSFSISVETFKGVVQLSGFVDSQRTVDQAGRIASSVEGVKSVQNNLVVK
jgi:osmotically-inducible protein OsmY